MSLQDLFKETEKLIEARKGGSGSGNFGHQGIPGKRGGSTSKGGSGGAWTGKVIPRMAEKARAAFDNEVEKMRNSGPQKSPVEARLGLNKLPEGKATAEFKRGLITEEEYANKIGRGSEYYTGLAKEVSKDPDLSSQLRITKLSGEDRIKFSDMFEDEGRTWGKLYGMGLASDSGDEVRINSTGIKVRDKLTY